ncbi:hypothetical protein ACFY4C_41145 [Actinomadura viridis]|uniref:hypothetical protein n=1 Tax=Actinomadura viridis TaxID=58110 RepID=UPI0036954395
MTMATWTPKQLQAAERARDLLDAAGEADTCRMSYHGQAVIDLPAAAVAVRDAVVASGAASLAVAEELAETREALCEVLAELVTAVQELRPEPAPVRRRWFGWGGGRR